MCRATVECEAAGYLAMLGWVQNVGEAVGQPFSGVVDPDGPQAIGEDPNVTLSNEARVEVA